MYIPLVYEHLFYKYFVRRSGRSGYKDKRASLLMDVVILVYIYLFINLWHIKLKIVKNLNIGQLNYDLSLTIFRLFLSRAIYIF